MNATAPFRVIESPARGNNFMVVDDRGDAERGNWFIASTWTLDDAEIIAKAYHDRLHGGGNFDRLARAAMAKASGAEDTRELDPLIALKGLLAEFEKFTRYGSPIAREANEARRYAIAVLNRAKGQP